MSKPDARVVDNPWREFIENCMSGDNYFRGGEYHELLADLDRGYRAESLLAEAESRIVALQSRLDAAGKLADEWYAGDGYETGIPRIDEATNNRWSAKQECANELRAALGGESPANDEERK